MTHGIQMGSEPTNEVAARRKPRKKRVRETFTVEVEQGGTRSVWLPLWCKSGDRVRVTFELVERKGGKS